MIKVWNLIHFFDSHQLLFASGEDVVGSFGPEHAVRFGNTMLLADAMVKKNVPDPTSFYDTSAPPTFSWESNHGGEMFIFSMMILLCNTPMQYLLHWHTRDAGSANPAS